jgi:hypothetical protein
MFDRRNYRESIGKLPWRNVVWILPGLLMVAVMRMATNLYVVQEIVVALGMIALSTVAILAIAVAFLLAQEGIRRAAHFGKAGFILLVKLTRKTNEAMGEIKAGAAEKTRW